MLSKPAHSDLPARTPDKLVICSDIDPNQSLLIGVDEVGRGCLFGDLSVVACVLPINFTRPLAQLPPLPGILLKDSKQLGPKQRILSSQQLEALASFALVHIPAPWIDKINIHEAVLWAMKSAIQPLSLYYPQAGVLIDGRFAPHYDPQFAHLSAKTATLIQGDSQHASIACASIIAKVARDRLMETYDKIHPYYGLKQHKGYGTKAHLQALANFGALPNHRQSFAPIRKLFSQMPTNSPS